MPRDPLLKNEPARNSYGATSSSSGLEAGTGNAQPEETTGWFSSPTKQIIAGGALLLSGGMKVAELIVTSEWSCAFAPYSWRACMTYSERRTESYRTYGPFEPVRGMVMIGWILTYMLQLDYIRMIGRAPTDEDPTVGTRGYLNYCVTKDENHCRVTLQPVRSPWIKPTSSSPYTSCSLYGNFSMYVSAPTCLSHRNSLIH